MEQTCSNVSNKTIHAVFLELDLYSSYSRLTPTNQFGRLAIDKKYQGQGIGKILLIDALKRSYEISKEIGSFAVVVDPIDEEAEQFYKKYDFLKLPDSGKLMLGTGTLKEVFE
ncbi:MAG: GNAT family N-acetyltransferase [Chitinophagaceae bacterium]